MAANGKLKQCTFAGCRAIVKHGSRCVDHPHDSIKQQSTTDNKHIYNSKRWRSVRNVYYQQNPLCEMCLKSDVIKRADVVDHIKEIDDGGAVYDLTNLQSLCHYHHNNKTHDEKRKRNGTQINKIRI